MTHTTCSHHCAPMRGRPPWRGMRPAGRRLIAYCLAAMSIAAAGCSSGSGPNGPDFDNLIADAWLVFEQGDYAAASDQFGAAVARFPNAPEPYSGLGWSYFRSNDPERARDAFLLGAGKPNPPAGLYAGAAFIFNALGEFAASNFYADNALSLEPDWQFSHDPGLTVRDLHLVKAENHFLLGEFALALAEVVILNPVFAADVATSGGQGALAAEIERLRGAN